VAARYAIHPSIGIARIGNSPSFYLAPISVGGLPIECDEQGTMKRTRHGAPAFVQHFKKDRQIRRQGARFSIFSYDGDESPNEITSESDDVKRITWTVHLANKKACWFYWHERDGDLLLGKANSYVQLGIPPRNSNVKGADRRSLIIDPGPRRLTGAGQRTDFSKDTAPRDYPATFPNPAVAGTVTTLGDVRTDAGGRLVVIGGRGRAAGGKSASESDGWFDDLADGPVTCELVLRDGSTHVLQAWCIVGQPKYAPQLVNMITLDDIMCDVAVRSGAFPALLDPRTPVNFDRDIAPILTRPADLAWVANTPAMMHFAHPRFDPRDASECNRPNRERYASFHRQGPFQFAQDGVPMMPLIVGENPLMNVHAAPFLTLTETQLRNLRQWAAGRFVTTSPEPLPGVHELDRASVANCVGAPLSPGVEVTWSIRNPAIYESPWRIKHRHEPDYYLQRGLCPDEDETDETQGSGCEPGDLTKRLNPPWQADFFQCTAQYVSLHDGDIVDDTHFPIPPTYYAYWWPAQSPVQVISGALSASEQDASGVPAGAQVPFARGFNHADDAIAGWHHLGFVVNQNRVDGGTYPYFAEVERNHDEFVASAVAIGDISNVENATDVNYTPVFLLKPQRAPAVAPGPGAAPAATPITRRRRGLAVRY
jgi:L-lysine 6-oxidase